MNLGLLVALFAGSIYGQAPDPASGRIGDIQLLQGYTFDSTGVDMYNLDTMRLVTFTTSQANLIGETVPVLAVTDNPDQMTTEYTLSDGRIITVGNDPQVGVVVVIPLRYGGRAVFWTIRTPHFRITFTD